jgi:triacylglycerol esterase/lipase EstA (alpha/beta hydrolase family)
MMASRSRTIIGIIVVSAVVVLAVVGIRWLTRGETVDGAAPAPASAVILIPGYGGGAGGLTGLADFLRAGGREVVIADIGDGRGDLGAYGAQVSQLAAGLAAGGVAGVDLVGYSAGGLIARAAVESDPSVIARVATIASPHDGTAIAGLGAMLADESSCPLACRQLAPSSEFLETLRQPGDAGRWLSVYSDADEVVRPADSSELAGATNVEVTSACSTGALDHGAIVRSAATWTVVSGFLATGDVPADCTP